MVVVLSRAGRTCPVCADTGHVCENHPNRMWGGVCCETSALPPATDTTCEHGACRCGGAGIPCPACCPPIPADGTHSIGEAFTPPPGRAEATCA
jgi:hypothetical protein